MRYLLLLSVLLLTACSAVENIGQPRPCAVQEPEYVDGLGKLVEEWDDANNLANSTSRIQLSGPIADLQAIRREANRLEPPPCAVHAHSLLVLYMDQTIDTYIAFMSDEEDSEVQRLSRLANGTQNDFMREFRNLAK